MQDARCSVMGVETAQLSKQYWQAKLLGGARQQLHAGKERRPVGAGVVESSLVVRSFGRKGIWRLA